MKFFDLIKDIAKKTGEFAATQLEIGQENLRILDEISDLPQNEAEARLIARFESLDELGRANLRFILNVKIESEKSALQQAKDGPSTASSSRIDPPTSRIYTLMHLGDLLQSPDLLKSAPARPLTSGAAMPKAADRPRLSASAPEQNSAPRTTPPTRTNQSSSAKGPCLNCQHMRRGTSLAHATFNQILEALRPGLRSTHTRRLQEEHQQSGEFVVERESKRQGDDENYTRRPSMPGFDYCGIDELSSKYYCCEVKNRNDDTCTQFHLKTHAPQSRACVSCQYNRKTMSALPSTLDRAVFLR